MKYLYDDTVCINDNDTSCPQLGDHFQSGVEWTVRVDFEEEEISFKRNGGEPFTVARGHDIANSRFSLQLSFYAKGQQAEVIQPERRAVVVHPLTPLLSLFGLENDACL